MAITYQRRRGVSLNGLYEALAWSAPIGLFGLLGAIRVQAFVNSGSLVALLNAGGLGVLTTMFILRRPSAKDVDRSFASLITALIGNFLPFCFILSDRTDFAGYAPAAIQVVTLLLATWTVLALSTSMGVAPANRGIRTGGPYRFIRHPLYTMVILSQAALLMEYPSAFNFAVLGVAIVFKARMMVNEERVLRRDPEYQAYCEKVRHRVIPGIV